jgi:zinc transport system permease protein
MARIGFPRIAHLMSTEWLKTWIGKIAAAVPYGYWLSTEYEVRALIAIVLLGLICGAVGSLVVGNRMAFLSDALAHCAFAGVTLGTVLSFATNAAHHQWWLVPTVMITFGIVVGLAIAFVRENTNLANDTVIGVFFAFAVGVGVMLIGVLRRTTFMSPESFLFGSPLSTDEWDLVMIAGLFAATAVILIPCYNSILLASFNPSLARSRGIRVRLCNYILIVLLALIVNLCIKAVGVLLINAFLVVPAATAANLARSARGMFWWTIAVAIAAGISGQIAYRNEIMVGGEPLGLNPSGTIVLLCVAAFFVSLAVRMMRDRRRPAPLPN